MTEDYAETMK